jgi:hypothetical protein
MFDCLSAIRGCQPGLAPLPGRYDIIIEIKCDDIMTRYKKVVEMI